MTRALARRASDFTQRDGERIVERRHEDAAHDVDDADRLAGAGAADDAAAAGDAGGEVRGSQQSRFARDVLQDLLLVPDVIAGRHDVDAVAEDRVGDVAGHAESRGRILDVGDDEVDVALLDERGDGAPRDLTPGLAEDVANEKDVHRSALSAAWRNRNDDRLAPSIVEARQDDMQLAALRIAVARLASTGTSQWTTHANCPNVLSAR